MASNPAIKQALEAKLRRSGTVINADSIEELKQIVGMTDISNTQFRLALHSLHYKPGPVRVSRPHSDYMEPRPYLVSYAGS